MSILCPHWIPQHYAESDRAVLKAWQPWAIKIVWTGVPAHLDAALAAEPELIVVRDHPLSEEKDGNPQVLGRAHADVARRIADAIHAAFPSLDMNRLVMEGINEPELWGKNPPHLVAEYEVARLRRMHQHGLRAVVGNFNTGWPGDYGEKDSPVNWEPFAPMLAAMKDDDFLGVHEYWWLGGPEEKRPDGQGGWLWDAGRYLQCPADVPILITECGLDNAVTTGTHLGWHGLPGDGDDRARVYSKHLAWYGNQLRRDERIRAAFIFTHDYASADWETFSTRDETFLRAFLPALSEVGADGPWGDQRVWRWQWLCEKYGGEYGIDPRVIAAVIALESGGRVDAVSSAGAVGLMQVVPEEEIAGRPKSVLLRNPDLNVRTGASILWAGIKVFSGSLAHGLCAYYMGIGAVRQVNISESQNAQIYLRAFAAAWRALWGNPLPGDVGRYLAESAPLPPVGSELTAIRWQAEEAVREIEAAQAKLAGARQRLLEKVIAPLYRLENAGAAR